MSEQQSSADSAAALRLLAAEDERQSKLHELLETIREQIRLEVAPEHRPEGLFKNIQDAVYAMRGRTRLMDDAAITQVLNAPQTASSECLSEIAEALESRGYAHMTNGRDIGTLLDELGRLQSLVPAAQKALNYIENTEGKLERQE